MDMKLFKVVLWPKNPENKIREVSFDLAGVSVISGWSQKGKSALIHIVDYCLGGTKCAIPVGHVRDKVAWFGVVCQFPRGQQMLLARKNPGDRTQSPEMVMIEGTSISVPNEIDSLPVFGHDAVVKRLNQLAGLPSSGIADVESGYSGPPSFRDMAAFQFQPQHIIANPHTLFFKADTTEHREKLIRSVLPYVLGAVSATTLETQARLRVLQSQLAVSQSQLEIARKGGELWLPKLQHFYAVARDQNLIKEAPEPEPNWPPEVYLALLKRVSASVKDDYSMKLPVDASKQVIREITSIRRGSSSLLQAINGRKRKLEKVLAIRESLGDYLSAIGQQSVRLAPVGWFADQVRDSMVCPLCQQKTEVGRETIDRLAKAGDEIAAKLASLPSTGASLESESMEIEQEIREMKAELKKIEDRLNQWNSYSLELAQLSERRDFIHQFVGEMRSVIQSVEAGSDLGELSTAVADLAKQVDELKNEVNETTIRESIQSAVESIGKRIMFYARILGIEHASRKWQLDTKNLTLRTTDQGERTDFLWEIGSAANWMGYHVATLLALHEHFRSVKQNPVPKFLIIDQPSQAFFPDGLDRTSQPKATDDLSRLKKVFHALSKAIERTNRGLQIIVLEHADSDVWSGIPHVSGVESWREDRALIPIDWD